MLDLKPQMCYIQLLSESQETDNFSGINAAENSTLEERKRKMIDPRERREDWREPACAFLFWLMPFLCFICLLLWLVSPYPEADKLTARNMAIFLGGLSIVTIPVALGLLGRVHRSWQVRYKNGAEKHT